MSVYLVTGGAGFIGSHIVTGLIEAGHQVRVLDNLSTGNLANLTHLQGVDVVQGDIADSQVVSQVVDGVDGVFHHAALASVPLSLDNPLETNRVCVEGTLNILNQARLAGVRRVVYAASSSCYGDAPEPIKEEQQVPKTISPYGAAKLAGEYYCQAMASSFNLEAVSLRYFNVFGPRQDPDSPYSAVIPIFISRMLSGTPPIIHGDGEQSRDFVFVEDVVQANLKAMFAEGVSGQSFNIGNGNATTLLDLVRSLNELLGTDVKPQHDPPRPGDIKHSLANIAKAKAMLGYAPQVSFEEGLKRSIDFYRELVGA